MNIYIFAKQKLCPLQMVQNNKKGNKKKNLI